MTNFLTVTTRGIVDIRKLFIQKLASVNQSPANGLIRAMMSTNGATDIMDTTETDTTIGHGHSQISLPITLTMAGVTNHNSSSIVKRTLIHLAQAV